MGSREQGLMAPSIPADHGLVAPVVKDLIFWLALPGLVAVGSAALVWMLMQARMQLLAAKYQAALAKVEKESTQSRPGLDELLSELRVERRRFVRKIASTRGCETTILTLERLYLRQMPLTGWMQEEISLGGGEELPGESFLLQDVLGGPRAAREVSLVPI
jgi:hypothetical protein